MTATGLSLTYLRRLGFTAAVVESWVPHVGVRRDLLDQQGQFGRLRGFQTPDGGWCHRGPEVPAFARGQPGVRDRVPVIDDRACPP